MSKLSGGKGGQLGLLLVVGAVLVAAFLMKRGVENAAENVGSGTVGRVADLLEEGFELYRTRKDPD